MRWKLFLHGLSVTWNWKHNGNRYSLPAESFVGCWCTCLTSKHAFMWPHARILKPTLTCWIQPCIQASLTLSPFASNLSNVPAASPLIICTVSSLSRGRETTRGGEQYTEALSQWHINNRLMEVADVVHHCRPGRLQPSSTKAV